MKKQKKQQSPKTETAVIAQAIAEQIVENATPKAPSVKAIMHRISSLTAAAAQRVKTTQADPATVYAYTLREIETAARTYWKHHARA